MTSQDTLASPENISNGAHGPYDGLEGEQQKVHEAQEQVEHVHDADEKPPPCGLDPHIVPQESTVKAPDTEQGQKALQIRRTKKELVRAGQREENRRRKNERRLEGQRREFERKCEARKKAEEEATASTAACTAGDADDVAPAETGSKGKPEEHSKRGKPRPRQRNEEAPHVQPQPQGEERKMKLGSPRRSKGRKKPGAAGKADDQKVDTENDPAELLPGLDAGAAYLTNTGGEEHSLSPLMARPTSAVSFVPPLTPMTPLHGSASGSLEYSDVWGPCEDLQTSRESDYLFDPPQRWSVVPVLTPVESAQTRQDAADVLFEPPLERSGGSAGTAIPKVKIVMSEPRQIMNGMSAYVESRTNPKEVVFGAGSLIGAK